jgi:hypothetical protein
MSAQVNCAQTTTGEGRLRNIGFLGGSNMPQKLDGF